MMYEQNWFAFSIKIIIHMYYIWGCGFYYEYFFSVEANIMDVFFKKKKKKPYPLSLSLSLMGPCLASKTCAEFCNFNLSSTTTHPVTFKE